MRSLCAAALSLSCGLWLAFAHAGKPADDKADRAARLAERKKKYDDEYKDLVAQFQKAETPAAQKAIRDELRELVAITVGKVLAIAEDDPKDETGFEAAAFIVQTAARFGLTGADADKALTLLTENHAANPKVKDVLLAAPRLGVAGEKLVRTVAEKATDKEVKAVALLARGLQVAGQVGEEDDDEKKQAELVKAATELLNKAKAEAPDTKIGDSTVAKAADQGIESLKAVSALFVGKMAPDVESKLLDGKGAKLSDYKGKVVLLDVWATWCGPCRAMIPHERELVKKMKDKAFVLVSVSVDNKKEDLEKFLGKEDMPWTHWWDNGQESAVLKTYRVNAFPTLYVIDHTGVIRHKWVGNPGNDKIDAAIDELVKAAEKAKG
jgi:thiol-disulfide isomerase/thioredoxin